MWNNKYIFQLFEWLSGFRDMKQFPIYPLITACVENKFLKFTELQKKRIMINSGSFLPQ